MLRLKNINLISQPISGLLQGDTEAKLPIIMHSGEGSTKSTAAEEKKIKTKSPKILSNNNHKKRHFTHTIYTIYTLYLVMVILLQLNKTELYKMRMAVHSWQ